MSIAEGMKEIAELAKKQGNVDLYTRILELRIEMVEINQEKLKLQAKVNELEEGLRVKDQMTFTEPFWYRDGDATPHCPACYEKDNRAIHLISLDHAADGRFTCPVCKLLCYGSGGRTSAPGSYRTGSHHRLTSGAVELKGRVRTVARVPAFTPHTLTCYPHFVTKINRKQNRSAPG